MRKPEYLSPTGIKAWSEDRDDFYARYLCDNRTDREPQTLPMSIGSSFDAHVKSYLHGVLMGEKANPRFELQALFEEQVEPHNRDWALDNGRVCFERYKESGALADLLQELKKAIGTPMFEIEVKGTVTANMSGVPFLGKPDIYFTNRHGMPVIYDWKVNGWCSKSNVSPKPGYLRLRHGSSNRGLDKGCHKDACPSYMQNMLINSAHQLQMVDEDWARQLAVYGWVCGMDVGSEFIVGIDQIACKPTGGAYPEMRIAEHRCIIGSDFQWATFGRACQIWNAIKTGHVFTELSKEENDARCAALDGRSALTASLSKSDDPSERAFGKL